MIDRVGKRIVAMNEIEAKLALLGALELLSTWGECVSSAGEDCPARKYCKPGSNPCAHAWLDAAIEKGME